MANYFVSIEVADVTDAQEAEHIEVLKRFGQPIHLQYALFFLSSHAPAEAITKALMPYFRPEDRLVIVEAIDAHSHGYDDEWAAVLERWERRTVH